MTDQTTGLRFLETDAAKAQQVILLRDPEHDDRSHVDHRADDDRNDERFVAERPTRHEHQPAGDQHPNEPPDEGPFDEVRGDLPEAECEHQRLGDHVRHRPTDCAVCVGSVCPRHEDQVERDGDRNGQDHDRVPESLSPRRKRNHAEHDRAEREDDDRSEHRQNLARLPECVAIQQWCERNRHHHRSETDRDADHHQQGARTTNEWLDRSRVIAEEPADHRERSTPSRS